MIVYSYTSCPLLTLAHWNLCLILEINMGMDVEWTVAADVPCNFSQGKLSQLRSSVGAVVHIHTNITRRGRFRQGDGVKVVSVARHSYRQTNL